MRKSLIGLAAAVMVVVGLSGTSASAISTPCALSGGTLTVTAPAGTTAVTVLIKEQSPTYSVVFHGVSGATSCTGDQSAITVFDVSDTANSVSTWGVSFQSQPSGSVVMHNEPADEGLVIGRQAPDTWSSVGTNALDSDTDGTADVTWAVTPSVTTFQLNKGPDTLDLQGTHAWTGATEISTSWTPWPGQNVIDGGDGPDVIRASDWDDLVRSYAGDDTVWLGWGRDDVDPGPGDDTVWVGNDNVPDQVRASEGSDTLRMLDPGTSDPTSAGGDAGPNDDDTWGAFETVYGSDSGWDTIVAPPSGVTAFGGRTGAVFVSGPGDDVFDHGTVSFARLGRIEASESHVEGQSAPYTFVSTATADNGSVDTMTDVDAFIGSPGDDILTMSARTVRPGKGDDLVGVPDELVDIMADTLPDGADRAVDGALASFYYSDRTTPVTISLDGQANDGAPGEGDLVPASSSIWGGKAGDTLIGSPLDDTIWAESGNDRIIGKGGRDQVFGSGGNDTFVSNVVGDGNDQFIGGPGWDTVTYAGRTKGVFATITYRPTLTYPAEYDVIQEVEHLIGTGYADVLVGFTGSETLEGLGGADRLTGEAGADVLVGGLGRDVLSGGSGNDRFRARDGSFDALYGGTGYDSADADSTDGFSSIERRY